MKSNNAYLKSIAKKTGNDDTEGHHSDNYYLKRIEDKIGKGGGGGDFSGDYNDLYNKPFIPSDVKDLTDTDDTAFTPKSHTHTESEITDLGDYADASHTHTESDITDLKSYAESSHTHTERDITDLGDYVAKSDTNGLLKNDGTVDTTTYLTEHQDLSDYIQKSNTSGLVKNDGSIDVNTYLTQHQDITGKSDVGHTHLVEDITDFPNIEFVVVTDNKGTASASTMNKLYIVSENSKVNAYYTVEDDGSYSWVKLDENILDDITIPTDVADLTDTHNTQFTPKSHTHTESEITDLKNYLTQHQDITGKEDNSNKSSSISTDTGSTTKYPTVKAVEDYAQPKGNYLTQHQDISGKLDKAQTNYKGKNVVVDASTGEITFENKYSHPTAKQCNYAYTHPSAKQCDAVIPSAYTHPSSKQCDYSYTHPSAKQCNATIPTKTSDLTNDGDDGTGSYSLAGHKHYLPDLLNTSTVNVVVTYTDNTSETIKLVKYTGL